MEEILNEIEGLILSVDPLDVIIVLLFITFAVILSVVLLNFLH